MNGLEIKTLLSINLMKTISIIYLVILNKFT